MKSLSNTEVMLRRQLAFLIGAVVALVTSTTALSDSFGVAYAQTAGPSWLYTGNLNTARAGHTATLLPNGQVLVVGASLSAELYDPSTEKWSITGSPSVGRCATLLLTGKVLFVGAGSAELYDPATGTFTGTGNMIEGGTCTTATLLNNGKVLITGYTQVPFQNPIAATPELYDPATGTFSLTGKFADTHNTNAYGDIGLIAAPATLLRDGRVLIAAETTAQIYDPVSGTFSPTGVMTTGRFGVTPGYIDGRTATVLRNGKVLLTGGEQEDLGRFDSAELYDPTTGTFTATGNMHARRALHTATLLPDGRVLVTGGETEECAGNGCWFAGSTASAEIYDPSTGSFSLLGDMNARRSYHTATLLNNGRVLVAGGDYYAGIGDYRGTLASAELYNTITSLVSNAIDDAQFFTRQQYLDFLGREPDALGQAHWTSEITMCSDAANRFPGETEAQCIDRKRTNTSGAFYLSNEFQNSANFLIRVNWGSLGQDRAVGRNCIVGQYSALEAVCRPLYSDYISDLAKLTQGIVVNDALDPNAINLNKHSFVNEFVTRPDFLAAYPSTMTATEYVDKLIQTTGAALTSQERADLIAKVGTDGRAAVLYDLVDGTITIDGGALVFNTRYGRAFYDQEFNPAFVFVEYLGYLRRNPDQAGFDHWLGKLNLYGNFVDAEMVRAFIVSDEYRKRFGQP